MLSMTCSTTCGGRSRAAGFNAVTAMKGSRPSPGRPRKRWFSSCPSRCVTGAKALVVIAVGQAQEKAEMPLGAMSLSSATADRLVSSLFKGTC